MMVAISNRFIGKETREKMLSAEAGCIRWLPVSAAVPTPWIVPFVLDDSQSR